MEIKNTDISENNSHKSQLNRKNSMKGKN